jgi:hypothetical protein
MTTDTVKDVRSIGSGCGSLAALSAGGNSNAGSPPSRPARSTRQRTTARARAPSYDARNGRSKWVEHWVTSLKGGLAWTLRRLAEGSRAAASPGWPHAMDVIAAR